MTSTPQPMNIIRKLWRKFTRKRRRGNRRVSISLRPEAYGVGRKLAGNHNRSFSSLVEILIEQEAQRAFAEPPNPPNA